jgi:hypothetical protein
MAFVGPGVRKLGVDQTWASETDTQPTIMAMLGLTDDYTSEGAVLTELVRPGALPRSLADPVYAQLASVYTQLESPVGPFGLDTLTASTRGLASGSGANDRTYAKTEAAIATLGAARDAVGSAMMRYLEGAAFDHHHIPRPQADRLIAEGEGLLRAAQLLAG